MLNFRLMNPMKLRAFIPITRGALQRQIRIEQEKVEGLLRERDSLMAELEGSRWEKDSLMAELEGSKWERDRLHQERESLRLEIETGKEKQEAISHDRFSSLLRKPEEASRFIDNIILGLLRKHHRAVSWGDRLLTLDKTRGFEEDKRFLEASEQIKGSQAYDQYASPDGISWRLNTLVWAARCALNIPGDFVECGVFKGDMSWVVSHVIDFSKQDKQFYLYDTFEGFSPKYSSKEDFPLNPDFFEFANATYRVNNLAEQVGKRFERFNNIKIIKGNLPDTLRIDAPKKISYLHMDLNSPIAEIETLKVLFDRVEMGGAIILDDYGWMEYIKQKRAHDEFMSSRNQNILELPTGQGLVIKR